MNNLSSLAGQGNQEAPDLTGTIPADDFTSFVHAVNLRVMANFGLSMEQITKAFMGFSEELQKLSQAIYSENHDESITCLSSGQRHYRRKVARRLGQRWDNIKEIR
jgi:hypothetical protein